MTGFWNLAVSIGQTAILLGEITNVEEHNNHQVVICNHLIKNINLPIGVVVNDLSMVMECIPLLAMYMVSY